MQVLDRVIRPYIVGFQKPVELVTRAESQKAAQLRLGWCRRKRLGLFGAGRAVCKTLLALRCRIQRYACISCNQFR